MADEYVNAHRHDRLRSLRLERSNSAGIGWSPIAPPAPSGRAISPRAPVEKFEELDRAVDPCVSIKSERIHDAEVGALCVATVSHWHVVE